ncbi:glycosyltransferase [Alteromonas pelagimontana]|uniref:Glycosyltransferase n=1 Tax=Alteromonas pelagimontana TaxID=1858656 RepID=A0A6M4MHN9_9ALTE|nr:galactosyltransferase-related protein [Alteromonas pelagimontana]QJR82639.1 glycosyltransferase [Alteromonas pelagimontana]
MNDKFSVVTIVKNRFHELSNLISSLESSSVRPQELVIVWMTAPTDHSLIKSEHFEIVHRFETSSDLPLPQARNKAFVTCRNDKIFHLDVDCACSPEFFELAMDSWQDDRVLTTAVTRVETLPEHATFENIQRRIKFQKRDNSVRSSILEMQDFQSAVFAISKKAFSTVGGFDESYCGFGIGDIDFATRCESAGFHLFQLPMRTFAQYRPGRACPVNHVLDIVNNVATFKRKWGFYPAVNWLNEFASKGIIFADFEEYGVRIRRLPTQQELSQAITVAHSSPSDNSTTSAPDSTGPTRFAM